MRSQKQSADLIRMAEVTRAVSHLTPYYAPKEKKAGKDPENWKKYGREMQQGSQELIKAVKSGDPMAVKTAATNLNASCTDCHGDFRD